MGDAIEAAPKKIVICCDGTWQSSVSGKYNLPSNITRLARSIARAGKDETGKVWQQMIFYDAGVGTGSLSKIESDRQGATGDGLVVNVLEAYNFVVNNYTPGDKIYCFGFSRGAFTARAIAGMITDFGVIKPDNMKHFSTLFQVYQKNTAKYNFRKTKEYFEWYQGKAPLVPESQKETLDVEVPWYDMGHYDIEHPDSRQVELVGVFDTVGSLGLADTYVRSHASSREKFEWLNVKWNPYIKHAFHALALDDRREPFQPTLYYIPKQEVIDAENKVLALEETDWPELTEHRKRIDEQLEQQKQDHPPDLVQVWFTGVHINVGGGTDDAKTDFEGLANITFAWMVEQCRPYLAFESFTNALIANYLTRMMTDDVEKDHRDADAPQTGVVATVGNSLSAAGKWVGSFFKGSEKPAPKEKMVRGYRFRSKYAPAVRPGHWTQFKPQDSYSLMYQAISSPLTRSPGAADDRSTEKRFALSLLGETNEWIHPSVQWRLETSKKADQKEYHYKSDALAGFEYKQRNGVWGWAKGMTWIPEWPIFASLLDPKEDEYNENSEMALVEECGDKDEVRKFLKAHAKDWQNVKS